MAQQSDDSPLGGDQSAFALDPHSTVNVGEVSTDGDTATARIIPLDIVGSAGAGPEGLPVQAAAQAAGPESDARGVGPDSAR